jgi:Na+/H+-dicarboxylate symporter
MLSYIIGHFVFHLDLNLQLPQSVDPLIPAWNYTMPKFIGNDRAMFAGLIVGILSALFKPAATLKIADLLDRIIDKIFLGIVCIMPLFIAGFAIKLIHDKIIYMIITQYAGIFIAIAVAQYSYICLLYLIYSKFNLSSFWQCLKNMIPASIAGLGTMSSAASMPLTVIGTEKNSNYPTIVRAIIPTTVNIHLIGDCFAIPVFAFAVLKTFGMPDPTFLQYVIFALYFVLAKFSAAGVPAGGIMVMLPVLAAHLGFNPEMSTLITALYVLFDPIFTCANILGNGAFALLIANLYERIKRF